MSDTQQVELDLEAARIEAEKEDQRRLALVKELRACADFLEMTPGLRTGYSTTAINIFANSREEIEQFARLTSWKKSYTGNWFMLVKSFGNRLRIEVNISRDEVCERVVKGTRVVPARPAVEEHTEEVVEWICHGSLLGD